MAKRRKKQQALEDESRGAFQSLFSDWIVNSLDRDFGIDFEVRVSVYINNTTQEVEDQSFYVQLKSSEKKDEDDVYEDLDIDDIELYTAQHIPVLLVKYIKASRRFYYILIQPYVWDVLDRDDPDWRRATTKRLRLTTTIDDLNALRDDIIHSQKRITRRQSYYLGLAEGIRITEDEVSELPRYKERNLLEYKTLSLVESYQEFKKGEDEQGKIILEEVYNAPKDDEAKVRAIIGLVISLNPTVHEENLRVQKLCIEGIGIAKDIDKYELADYIQVQLHQAQLIQIVNRMTQVAFLLKYQQEIGETIGINLLSNEMQKLIKILLELVTLINKSLVRLLDNGQYYLYASLIPSIINLINVQIMNFGIFDRTFFQNELDQRNDYIKESKKVIEAIDDPDLAILLNTTLANYYYILQHYEIAIEHIERAISLARDYNHLGHVRNNERLLEKMRARPDPYEIPDLKPVDEMTSTEYKQMHEEFLPLMGINLNGEDDTSQAIRTAIDDMDPSDFFRHCEHLRISYRGTSLLGRMVGIPTMGSKVIWCKYGSAVYGFDLGSLFQDYSKINCKGCQYRKVRGGDWICTVAWVKEQEEDKEFQSVLDRLDTL